MKWCDTLLEVQGIFPSLWLQIPLRSFNTISFLIQKTYLFTFLTSISMQPGQMENTEVQKPKYGNGNTETEVQEWEEICLSVTTALLTYEWMCLGLVAKEWLSPSMWELNPGISGCSECCYHDATVSVSGQTQLKTNSDWDNHAGSMLLMFSWQWYGCQCCHSSSPRIFTGAK